MAARVAIALVVVALVVFGLRARASIALADEVNAFRTELFEHALAPRRGVEAVPSEADVRREAAERAAARALELSDVVVRIERNVATSSFAGRRVAETLGPVGARTVDAEGNVARAPAQTLRTTRLRIRAHVRGEGFLVTHEADVEATREIGYGL